MCPPPADRKPSDRVDFGQIASTSARAGQTKEPENGQVITGPPAYPARPVGKWARRPGIHGEPQADGRREPQAERRSSARHDDPAQRGYLSRRVGTWPMEGWLHEFRATGPDPAGVVGRTEGSVDCRRHAKARRRADSIVPAGSSTARIPHSVCWVGRIGAQPVVTVRRVGVEEELLLVDPVTGELRPVARDVIAACGPVRRDGVQVKHEFFNSQVEVASRPHVEIDAIRDELTAARAHIADVGSTLGVAPLAVPGPVLATAPPRSDDLSPGQRYAGSNGTTATWPVVR